MGRSKRFFIVPVFLPQIGCPHQCAFCNQEAITGVKQKHTSPDKLRLHIDAFLRHKGKHREAVQIAFYGGNFLGQKEEDIESLLTEANMFVKTGKVDSIRISTRPDTIDNKKLDILDKYPVSTVELGVQSMDDRVLALSKRGHTSQDTVRAVNRLQKRNVEIGLQMMVGLPGDNEKKCISTGHRMAALSPDFVRIYPTVVLENSLLAKWYQEGKYTPLSLEQSVTLVKKLYLLFKEKKIRVIRMGLQPSKDLQEESTILAGPFHPAFGHLVHSEIFLDKVASIMESQNTSCNTTLIAVHPRSVSRVRGLRNSNVEILKQRFQIKSLNIVPDPALGENSVVVSTDIPPLPTLGSQDK